MKKVKRERGFYKELSAYLKLMKERKPKRMWVLEFWLKHNSDQTKDIRFYAKFHSHDEIGRAMDYAASKIKEDYEDPMLLRTLDRATTRKQKAIQRSQLSSVPHINEIS